MSQAGARGAVVGARVPGMNPAEIIAQAERERFVVGETEVTAGPLPELGRGAAPGRHPVGFPMGKRRKHPLPGGHGFLYRTAPLNCQT